VDDNSDDGSYSKLYEAFKGVPKIKLYKNEINLGYAFNKRRSVELATNSWVIQFDSDNVITPHYLDVVFDHAWHEDVILQPEYLMPTFDFRAYSGVMLNRTNISSYIDLPMLETALNAHNFFVNRDNYLKVTENQTDAITSDSIQFSLKWLESNRSIYITPDLWYWHTVHELSHYKTQNHLTPKGLHENILQQLRELK